MPKDKSFHDYVVYDLMGDMPDISSKAMFGGWGIYKNGVIFAIIADGELYFKVSDENRAEFEKMESRPFTYSRKGGKPIGMSYWLIPEGIMEDREKFAGLVEASVVASRKKKA